jgi:hypothetical protein
MKNLSEKSVSKAQQRFMGMVHAVQKGKMAAPSAEVAAAAKDMSKKAAKDYAETKHKGLPEKVSEAKDDAPFEGGKIVKRTPEKDASRAKQLAMMAAKRAKKKAIKKAKNMQEVQGAGGSFIKPQVRKQLDEKRLTIASKKSAKGTKWKVKSSNPDSEGSYIELRQGKRRKDTGDYDRDAGTFFMGKGNYGSAKDILKTVKEENLDEIYHSSYSSAIEKAVSSAKKRGYEVDPDDYHQKVATGPRKPSEGKTVSHNLKLTKDGKPTKKGLAIQVYNRGGNKTPYELNHYISEESDKKEADDPVTQEIKKRRRLSFANKLIKSADKYNKTK